MSEYENKNPIDYIISILEGSDFIKCSLSSPIKKSQQEKSIIILATKSGFSVEIRYTKHNNITQKTLQELKENELEEMFHKFKQCLLKTTHKEHQILTGKKKSKFITKTLKSSTIQNSDSKTNRKKAYLIPDGTPCSFLTEIGVMNKTGKVLGPQYKKFKQINRFLEMVDDLFKMSNLEEIRIIDFGCGKSYLTFALYHYFTDILKRKAIITGLDLKQDVIDECNLIAGKLNYENLVFKNGMLKDFDYTDQIDFVVTLHACDTATDEAILFAIKHKAKNMFFVPCCQHELNKQIQNQSSTPMLKHGIFKDRLTALVTDSMRAQLLETCGYKVQSLEFIESEHNAKNILLRCQKVDRPAAQLEKIKQQYASFKDQWAITPYLESEIIKNNYWE